jgi:hypothetical protein
MDHLKIIRDIEMRNFKPIYFLMGEEPYFIDLISDKIAIVKLCVEFVGSSLGFV